MSNYPRAKMPDYGDGPEPCGDCATKDKRIVGLQEKMSNYRNRRNYWKTKANKQNKRIEELEEGLKEILDCDSYGYTKSAEFVSHVASRVLKSEGGGDD